MDYEYPPMPAHDPTGPNLDGFGVDVHVDERYIEFTLPGGGKVRIPGTAIVKDSCRVIPGNNERLNMVQIAFYGGQLTFGENVMWNEIVPPRGKVSVDGKVEDLRRALNYVEF